MSKYFQRPFILGILGLISIITSKIVELSSGEKIHPIAWLASGFVMVSSIMIRYWSINEEVFSNTIKETNHTSYDLDPKRYLDWITRAMIIGFFATITIRFNFIAGMLVYLLMQLSLIRAFSGIFIINPKIAFSDSSLKSTSYISVIFWSTYVIIVYVFLVYNGSESLIVIPYVICLGIMAHLTWYGLAYNRTPLFKYMFILASAVFVFSDSLIGNNVYSDRKVPEVFYHTIDMTYVLNIFLMSQAILFLKDKTGRSVLKEQVFS